METCIRTHTYSNKHIGETNYALIDMIIVANAVMHSCVLLIWKIDAVYVTIRAPRHAYFKIKSVLNLMNSSNPIGLNPFIVCFQFYISTKLS